MAPKIAGDPPTDAHRADNLLDLVPELPSITKRWTVRRKATVVEAVRGGWVPLEAVCRQYQLSVDEFMAWERDIDRYGIPGLRTTRYQIYRQTECAGTADDGRSVQAADHRSQSRHSDLAALRHSRLDWVESRRPAVAIASAALRGYC